MNRTQIWCDNPSCGRFIQDKWSDNGSEHPATIDNADKSWEIWSTDVDLVFCSLGCLAIHAQALETDRVFKEATKPNIVPSFPVMPCANE